MKIKRFMMIAAVAAMSAAVASAQENVNINIKAQSASGTIDEMLYGQLFEHIYFSANNGVWQELINERSFEPEQFPGIPPTGGFFDGWYMDEENVLHSPTRFEQPLHITTVNTDSYEITMDVNWRSYKFARHSWSGGLLDMRFAVKDSKEGEPYFVRIHNPYYEARILNVGQTESQIQAAQAAQARAALAQKTNPYFAISRMVEKETEMGGRTRVIKNLEPFVSKDANTQQINENRDWHKLRIVCQGSSIKVYWDGKSVVSYSKLQAAGKNSIDLWVNYTEVTYKNIKVTSLNGRTVYFEGTPEDVKIPSVAPQWNTFGDADFELVKGDAVSMDYSQKITANSKSGLSQGPQNLKYGNTFIGSIYAKGNGTLSVALKRGDNFIVEQKLGVPGSSWKKFDIALPTGDYSGDADFAICVENGTVQVDMVTLSTAEGLATGGFRPDILQAVKDLHPTCLRWPGGGYASQYQWKWGIGRQEDRFRWPYWQWLDYDQNCFGTDEFIKFCREIGSEPVIVVPVGYERPDEEREEWLQNALDWLRYCNEPASGEWGKVRAANGHPEPYNVKYWEIDNEQWEFGIEKYEACVRLFSAEMRKIDPSIKIIVCGGFSEDEDFFMRSANYFDYVSLHHYENANGYATGPRRLGEQYDRYAKMFAKCPNPNVKLFISEWNLNSTDWRTGLFAGGFLNECEARDVVAMGAAALFLRRTDATDWNNAFINFDYQGLFVAPNFLVTELWYNHFSKYRVDYSGDTKELSIMTTMSENGKDVIVKVVNPTETPYTLNISGDWKGIENAGYEYYAPGSLSAANSMFNPGAVNLKRSVLAVPESGLSVKIAPLSAGVITIEKEF